MESSHSRSPQYVCLCVPQMLETTPKIDKFDREMPPLKRLRGLQRISYFHLHVVAVPLQSTTSVAYGAIIAILTTGGQIWPEVKPCAVSLPHFQHYLHDYRHLQPVHQPRHHPRLPSPCCFLSSPHSVAQRSADCRRLFRHL
jgi:hypothetical protein